MAAPVRTPRDQLDRLIAIARRGLRFWWVGAAVVALGTATAIGAATLKHKVWRSESVLLYREGIRSSYVLGRDAETEAARKLGLRLKEMVLARPRLQKIIDELGVYKDVADRQGYVVACDMLRESIDFKVREGDTFLLAFNAPDPVLAQKVTAKLADSLVEENSRYRSEQAETTRSFLAQEKERMEAELKDKETALAGFLARHPEFAEDQAGQLGQGGAAVRAADKQKKAAGDPVELALEREASRLRQRLATPTGEKPKPAPKATVDPRLKQDVTDAENELLAAERDLSDKQARLTDQHPDVVAAKNRVRLAQTRLASAKEALASGALILPEVEAPPATEEERPKLQQRLSEVESELAAHRRSSAAGQAARKSQLSDEIVDLETEWAKRNRDVTEARERYQQLESKNFVAEMAASSEETGQASQMVIVDPAFRPVRPVGGGRMKLVILGFMASCALGLAVVLGCAVFDDRLYERADVDHLAIAPLIVTVPRTHAGLLGGKSRG
jgi:uncharacterized protein involved in exopolysaccharide biosynthesis